MNMKNASTKFFAAILFSAIAIASLRAQTVAGSGPTNATISNAAAPAMVDGSQVTQPSSAHVNIPGIHIGGSSSEDGEDFGSRNLALMIPIIAIVMGCSIPIIVGGLSLYFRHRKNQMLHETVRAMVEKGVPVPPEMFSNQGSEPTGNRSERDPFGRVFGRTKQPRNDLRSGVMLTCIGIGIVLFIGKPGWIILFLGVAFLVIASFEKNNKNDDQPPKP